MFTLILSTHRKNGDVFERILVLDSAFNCIVVFVFSFVFFFFFFFFFLLSCGLTALQTICSHLIHLCLDILDRLVRKIKYNLQFIILLESHQGVFSITCII